MSNQKVEIDNDIICDSTNSIKMHELTMLYLKAQDISNINITEFSKKYVDTYYEIYNSITEYKRVSRHTLH